MVRCLSLRVLHLVSETLNKFLEAHHLIPVGIERLEHGHEVRLVIEFMLVVGVVVVVLTGKLFRVGAFLPENRLVTRDDRHVRRLEEAARLEDHDLAVVVMVMLQLMRRGVGLQKHAPELRAPAERQGLGGPGQGAQRDERDECQRRHAGVGRNARARARARAQQRVEEVHGGRLGMSVCVVHASSSRSGGSNGSAARRAWCGCAGECGVPLPCAQCVGCHRANELLPMLPGPRPRQAGRRGLLPRRGARGGGGPVFGAREINSGVGLGYIVVDRLERMFNELVLTMITNAFITSTL